MQTIRNIVIPATQPGIYTCVILYVSIVLGEIVPMLMVGPPTYVSRNTDGVQVYLWHSYFKSKVEL